MKLKKAKNLDPRLEALIDNAFYACCPPERCGADIIVETLHDFFDSGMCIRTCFDSSASCCKSHKRYDGQSVSSARSRNENADSRSKSLSLIMFRRSF